ncbi:TPA: hypothetical protein N0F65_009690 [Lagenidium giganteum]|uniref:Uncharacterized protein n=1 Tax=Lagenidium giganteum TaxID=4803 RepID=A0AAV2YW89_9STRA|nr:TPA: hypothetical protein N0F65_009690 [Lagenidium giganteum]
MGSFLKANLILTCFDKKKNDTHVEVPDLVTPGKWHFLCLVHTHRQIRGSKMEVFLNAELRHTLKLPYPNASSMVPLSNAYLGMRERTISLPTLRVLLGPTALFGQPLPSTAIQNIKSSDDYDSLVLQFNAYISSSTSSTAAPGNSSSTSNITGPTSTPSDGLLFAYDARHCDRLKGLCYDASGNDNHAEAASAGVRLRQAGTFKQAIAQLGGPLVCLPLLVTSSMRIPDITVQFDEDKNFQLQIRDMVARPLGPRSIAKVVLLIAEIMRYSLVNKFIFRRNNGVRLMALLMRSLPANYLNEDLFTAIDRLRSAVVSDRTLADGINKYLLFNFRIWVNAPLALQDEVFDKLEASTRKDPASSSAVSTRNFLRCLSWIYWKVPHATALRRSREFDASEIDHLRKRVITILKIVLCDAQPAKSSVMSLKSKENKSQLSYESTRSLVFCMIGRPTHPMLSAFPSDQQSLGLNDAMDTSSSGASPSKNLSEREAEAGSVFENVPEQDLPDLLQLLIELSVQPSAPAGLLDLFARLGGLRIWLPLLDFPSDIIRVMTLRLLRTYLYVKCGCGQDRVSPSEKVQLALSDAYLIVTALGQDQHVMTLGVYSELLLILLGVQVTESDMKALDGKTEEFEFMIDEDMLPTATIWHSNMMFPFLTLVRDSPLPIRMVAIRHLKILFTSSTVASAVNRRALIFNGSSTLEHIPIVEAILGLRGAKTEGSDEDPTAAAPSSLFGLTLSGCPGVPMSRLRELVLSSDQPEDVRANAIYSIVALDDQAFLKTLLYVREDGDRKKQQNEKCFKEMPKRLKLALIQLIATMQPQGCTDFITTTSYDLISSLVCSEAKSNDLTWLLFQDPFTSLSRFISSKDELEVVVVSLLKTTLDKLNDMLSIEMNLRGGQDIPSRNSVLWRNAENLATLSAAIALHYDPDTLGKVDPSVGNSDGGSVAGADMVFWKCERRIWHEADLVESILGVWQHFTSYFHSDTDASFGRTTTAQSRFVGSGSSQSVRANELGSQSSGGLSVPTISRQGSFGRENTTSSKTNSGKMAFGFNILSSNGSAPPQPTAPVSIPSRPHPGGPMRQVLQLLLRHFYLVLFEDDDAKERRQLKKSDSSDINDVAVATSKLRLSSNTIFYTRINKLEFFIQAMGLGRDTTQFESSFAPSRGSGVAGSVGLVSSSSTVKASPGDETSLLLWFIPELAALIDRVRFKVWNDSAVKLASILSSLVSAPVTSSDALTQLLGHADFGANNHEVRRRDGFYHEQMAHAREAREVRRKVTIAEEVEEKNRAQVEIDRISRSTRTRPGVTSITAGTPDDSEQAAQVWLQRVKALDIDDWMKLRVLLRWGIRHVWGTSDEEEDKQNDDEHLAGVDRKTGELSKAFRINEFWRLDVYTSSNWIRCRLLPDTDDTVADHARYNTNPSELKGASETLAESLSISQANAMVMNAQRDAGDGDNELDDGVEDEYDDDADVDDSGGDSSLTEDESLINSDIPREERAGSLTRTRRRTKSESGDADAAASNELGDLDLVIDTKDEDDSGVVKRDSFIGSEAGLAVKSAREKIGRIGNIGSRFSTGIRRFKNSRSGSKNDDNAAESTNLGSLTTVTVSQSSATATGLERCESAMLDDGYSGQSGEFDTEVGEIESDAPTAQASQIKLSNSGTSLAAAAGGSPPPSATASRILRGFPTKHEQWKTLSASYRTRAYLILASGIMVYGMLRIGTNTIIFEGEYVTTLKDLAEQKEGQPVVGLGDAYVHQLKKRAWGVRVIRVIQRRRFLMDGLCGIELYFVDGNSCLLGLENRGEADLVYATVKERKPPCLAKWGKRLLTADRMFAKFKWTEMWVRREISNFEYLMLLNVAAGRSYNDITQYPIFPWILKDYSSTDLQLDDAHIYRDLRKPIGAQTMESAQRAKEKYEAGSGDSALPPCNFSTPYSTMRSVQYFLMRLQPFTSTAVCGNPSSTDAATLVAFDSIEEAFEKCTTEDGHSFELTPEFFFIGDFLTCDRNKQLSGDKNQSGKPASGDVALPAWATSAHDFIRQHRMALESDYVSANLHHWIDLIFGFKQRGQAAIDSHNIYHVACYPEKLDLSNVDTAVRSRLTQRGTVPFQLFKKAHPARMTHDESLEALYPTSHAMAALSSRRQVRRHDLTSKHTGAVVNIRFSNAVNTGLGMSAPGLCSGTGIGAHGTGATDHGTVVYTCDASGLVLAKRYLGSTPDQGKMCPFSLADVEQWWKLPSGCLVSEGVVFYEQMISCGYWDGSWRIHWSADGELLQRIAFHKKRILCMARSEDDFTGDLALAFGSEDCTVSVWALSKLAATRSRRMFVKKEPVVGGLPWVLLCGHTSPVVAVALNVDLDVVASSSKDNRILVHALRAATPLHHVEIGSPSRSVVDYLTISHHGDIMIHTIIEKTIVVTVDDPFAAPGTISKSYQKIQQSELVLMSMNGRLVSHNQLTTNESQPQVLLRHGIMFTRSGEYIITATGGQDAAIEVRDAGLPASVVRRIECKRSADLTYVSMSQDERCILCGYEDGSVVAYAFHFGISDGCKSLVGLDKKAREEEAEAIARANKRELLKKETAAKRDDLFLFKRHTAQPQEGGGLWIKAGRQTMPSEPFLTEMQTYYALLKQPCVSGEAAYEDQLTKLWRAVYITGAEASTKQSQQQVATSLMDIPIDDIGTSPDQKEYERVGESWSRLGFQRPDPTTDFRAGGMLSLHCLVYFATNFTEQATRMVNSQVPGSHENTYPWGPAGINITCMLARQFWKMDGELSRERAGCWTLFGEHNAFFKMFCEVFALFDFLWSEMNADYGAFSMVMQATTERVLEVLEETKGDIHLLIVELRSQSGARASRTRGTSRSMDDFLINMTIAPAASGANSSTVFSSSQGAFTPATPPSAIRSGPWGNTSSTMQLPPPVQDSSAPSPPSSMSLLDLSSPTMQQPAGNTASGTAGGATAPVFDPFAGNDISALATQPATDPDDPFACLLNQ